MQVSRRTHRSRSLRGTRLAAVAAAGLLAATSLVACSASGTDQEQSPSTTASKVLGADTKCSDYLTMSQSDQVRVIQNTSRELDDEFISSSQAMTAVDSIKQFCQEEGLQDGTMRDIAEAG